MDELDKLIAYAESLRNRGSPYSVTGQTQMIALLKRLKAAEAVVGCIQGGWELGSLEIEAALEAYSVLAAKAVSPRTGSVTLAARDMTDESCDKCKAGIYKEAGFHDDMDGTLLCTACNDEINRWQPGHAKEK